MTRTTTLPRAFETSSRNDTVKPTSQRKGKPSDVHRCGTCFRTFNWREHRIRHERCRTFCTLTPATYQREALRMHNLPPAVRKTESLSYLSLPTKGVKIWELILASSCRDLVARHETVIHGLVRKYRKGPRPRDKATGLEGADELSDENGTESQQEITKNMIPDLQRTQDQGRSQGTTEEPTRASEITQQMSLQNNLDPALMDNGGPTNTLLESRSPSFRS
ncbi:hypothetical protein BGZ57DRAFT_140439 [Hyaloscypha finlandica]|nr:hypothetical protein BGZ57DRAFT_140439 [Hyaloscypha finlandica]